MSLNFPNNPSIGQTFTGIGNGTVWKWDGYVWDIDSISPSDIKISGYVTYSETGAFYPASNPNGFITSASLGAHFHSASDITGGTLNNARTSATANNVINTIVLRDNNGNFVANNITSSLTIPKTSSVIFNDTFGSDYIITGGVDDKLFLRAGGNNILEIDNTNGYPIWKFKDSLGSLSKIGVFTDIPATEFHVNGVITATGISTTSKPTVNGIPVLLSGEASPGSIISRGTASITTTSIAASGTFNGTVDFGCKSYGLLSVSSTSGAWVKLYYDTASRANDSTRTIDLDPGSNVSLMAECLSTGTSAIRFAPTTIGYNEGTSNLIPIAIGNTRNTAATYTVTFNFLKLEL
jgi:hypothetical protein